MTTSTTKHHNKDGLLRYAVVALVWLAVWEGLSLFVGEELLFSSPASVAVCLSGMARTIGFWQIIVSSVIRLMGGFLFGFVLASALAFLSYRSEFFRLLISPAISIVKSTPVASFIILALMWLGKDTVPLVIGVLMVMPIVWSNVLEGLRSIDKNLLEMATVYRLTALKKIKNIYIPSLIPFCMAAVKSGLGLCWKAGIAAEVICRTLPSIGNSIWETKFYLKTDEMFAWTATVIMLSVAFDFFVNFISKPVLKRYGQIEETESHEEKQAEETFLPQNNFEKFETASGKTVESISLSNVSFSYGESTVLKDLNLDIPGKGVTVISAPSGAGKTTLLRIISGLNLSSGGEVRGVPERISYVFQEQRLLPWRTAIDNVKLVGGENAEALLASLGITEELAKKYPPSLSGGERQRVCIARALCFGGDALLLDEPFTGLDKENRERALQLIRSYAKDRPVILVSHLAEDLKEAETVIEL